VWTRTLAYRRILC